jgi:hypothetical protein
MADARLLSPRLPEPKLLIEGRWVNPATGGKRREGPSGGREPSHHTLEGSLQMKAVWTKLPAGV